MSTSLALEHERARIVSVSRNSDFNTCVKVHAIRDFRTQLKSAVLMSPDPPVLRAKVWLARLGHNRDRGLKIGTVPAKSGHLATMWMLRSGKVWKCRVNVRFCRRSEDDQAAGKGLH